MNKIIFVVLLLVSNVANAWCEKDYLTVNLASHHFSEEEYNEKNYGLGVMCKDGYIITSIGAYYNSFEHTSLYTSVGVEKMEGMFGAAISLMAVTGYEDFVDDAKPISFVPLPEFIFRHKRYSLRVGYLPSTGETEALATMRINYEFGKRNAPDKQTWIPIW